MKLCRQRCCRRPATQNICPCPVIQIVPNKSGSQAVRFRINGGRSVETLRTPASVGSKAGLTSARTAKLHPLLFPALDRLVPDQTLARQTIHIIAACHAGDQRENAATIAGETWKVFKRGKTSQFLKADPALNVHRLQLSSGSCQTMLSRIRSPARSIHCSAFQQAKTNMTTKRHPPTVVKTTSRIDGRGDVALAPQAGQTSFTLDP